MWYKGLFYWIIWENFFIKAYVLSDYKIDWPIINILKPKLTIKIEKNEHHDKLIRLNEELEDNDDVQNCFSNLDFDSELLEVNNAW